jgi:hypothetical protein
MASGVGDLTALDAAAAALAAHRWSEAAGLLERASGEDPAAAVLEQLGTG